MNLLNTLNAWQWSLLALVPLGIILLYFLKLKRQPLEVPSTYLWQRTIEDLHVNSIWQRLRRNLLLFLQLLIVALVALALLRPGWRGLELTGNRFIFALDNSASMQARDQQPTRLAAAKREALRLVDQMKSGDVGMVIAFSDSAQVVQTFSESRRALRRRIEQIQPSNHPTDVREALRAAAGLANPNYTRLQDQQAVDEALPATLYLFSDGDFPPVRDFSVGNLDPHYLPFGMPAAHNIAIVAFSTDRNPDKPDQLQAFARIHNYSPDPATVQLELFLDEQSIDVAELSLPAGRSGSWTFDLPDIDQGELKLVLSPDDVLAVDNTAYAAVNRPLPANVLVVTPGDKPLELALQTDEVAKIAHVRIVAPEFLKKPQYRTEAEAGMYDLIIYDQCAPTTMPAANTLLIGALPPDGRWKSRQVSGSRNIIDVDRTHPLTQLVDMDYVKIAAAKRLEPPPGSTVLMDAVIGPVCAIAPRGGFEDVVLGFTLVDSLGQPAAANTTWPLRPSFPVFVFNALEYLGGTRETSGAGSVLPGRPVTIRLPRYVERVTVVAPNGQRIPLVRQGNNAFVFTDTSQLGVYRVFEKDRPEPTQRFAVNLFDPRESDIRPQSDVQLGHETVRGTARLQPIRRELWKWLALCGLAVLMLEWYIYNRRVYL